MSRCLNCGHTASHEYWNGADYMCDTIGCNCKKFKTKFRCGTNQRHWFTERGNVGHKLRYCVRCGEIK